ncbi:MAG: hypothetical protein IPL43_05725 [Micropruina sp.]|nr:hypothetical protein [Micropruina sp.]
MNLKNKTALALGGTVIALGAGIGVAGFAQAETPSPNPTPSTSANTSTETSGKGGMDRGHGGERGADAAALATKLGLTEAQVTTAMDKVRETLKPATRPTTPPTEAERTAKRAAYITALAKELSVSEDKLTTAMDELKAAREADHAAALKTRLDAAVTAGTLTQAEADAVAKAATAGVISYGGGRR